MTQLLIYSSVITERLQYVSRFVFEEQLGLKVKFTIDYKAFQQSGLPNFFYGRILPENTLGIAANMLLFQDEIVPIDTNELEKDDLALIFFLLSRYEEYLSFNADKHERFPANESYLYQKGKLESPIVDQLVLQIREKLSTAYPNLNFKKSVFKIQPTIDIDQAYLYKHKSIKRFLGGNFRDFFKLNFKHIIDRKLSYFGFKKDPWDSFEWINKKVIRKQEKPRTVNELIYFFLMGDYAKFDKNLNWKNKGFQNKITSVAQKYSVGIHPSYASNQQPEKILVEKKRLENILNQKVRKSRQHYIKIQFPNTYQNLIKNGITDDYSMGFADAVGFRAGTSHSFYWYDLSQEKTTNLRVHPFSAMEVSMRFYMHLSLEKSVEKIKQIKSNVQKVNGTFCVLFHNESLSDYGKWKGWRKVFETAIA